MELPLRLISVIALVIIVLFVVNTFFLSQSGASVSQAEAVRIFNTQCAAYQKNNCDWSVTRQASFSDFLAACKRLYGNEREAFSCLYAFCQDCKQTEPTNVACEGQCRMCEGSKKLGVDTTTCCEQYASTCSTACSACA